ncbi:uncharacterized protein [Miscanthus floridulus]|uniref:uncharacterized protein n=1 Tax=Miscanthus floridulus TaxID=154761 RepID=UPI00345930E1
MAYHNYHPRLDNQADNAIKFANCTDSAWHSFEKEMNEKLWQVDGLLLASAIMAGVTVGIGAYGQRYRHHPITHLIFVGSTTLFLPIISSVVTSSTGYVSSVSSRDLSEFKQSAPALTAMCSPSRHSVLVIMWALLVQNVMINTSVVVAIDDREGPSIGPPLELLAQGAWTFYLGISFLNSLYKVPFYYFILEGLPFLLTLAKLLFKYYAVQKARQSFSFGRNPRLVAGYMQQLPPPPLLVMGEEARHVEKQPHGYVFKDDSSGTMMQNTIGLVTIDRVWQLLDSCNSSNNMLLPVPTPQRLKDLCLSFALFKLLRCRFARYELHTYASSQNTFDFFWSLLLSDGEPADRVFGVIANELSFLHDYYNSSLPISYSKSWLPVLGIIISLFSISYCIVLAVWIIIRVLVVWIGSYLHYSNYSTGWALRQIICDIRCKDGERAASVHFGNIFFDMVPLSLLLVFLIAAEVRDIVSYVCSNWTKVVLTCCLFPNTETSLSMRKWFVQVLRCRCKLIEHQWDDRIGQCSALPLHPRTNPLALFRHHLRLPDYKIKANAAMKVSIINALRSSKSDGGHLILSNGKASLYRSGEQGGERFLWACNSISVSNNILTWQIATSILEVRYPLQPQQQGSSSVTSEGDRTVATYLSRYCAYLVFCCPELLPDDDAWSKSMYEAVKKDAEHALAQPCCVVGRHYLSRSVSTLGYQQLVDLLSANSKHQVLKDGVKLGKKLVETISNHEAAWKLLASFWSEMILYITPSDNLKGHAVAIAHGGELITLLWALLNHVGIVSRTTSDDAARAAAGTSTPGVISNI